MSWSETPHAWCSYSLEQSLRLIARRGVLVSRRYSSSAWACWLEAGRRWGAVRLPERDERFPSQPNKQVCSLGYGGELETVGKGQKYITRTASLSEEGETEMYDARKTEV